MRSNVTFSNISQLFNGANWYQFCPKSQPHDLKLTQPSHQENMMHDSHFHRTRKNEAGFLDPKDKMDLKHPKNKVTSHQGRKIHLKNCKMHRQLITHFYFTFKASVMSLQLSPQLSHFAYVLCIYILQPNNAAGQK